jgi:methionyl aminopeptidase
MGKVAIKTRADIELMKEPGRLVADVLTLLSGEIRPGVHTRDLDAIAEDFIRSNGGIPAFKGYGHDRNNLFPGTLCVSIDDEVVHGIPDGRQLEEGQIVSVDVGVKKKGFFGDGARTFSVGQVSDRKRRLMEVTERALYKGIEQARAGNRLHDISSAVQTCVEAEGFSVVRDLVGHGIGKELHEEPAVPNYGTAGTGLVLRNGMALAIEPMVNAGTFEVSIGSDGWTVRTADGMPSAHFEHTIVVNDGEAEILTR